MMIQSKTNNHLSLIILPGVLYNCRETSTYIESSLQINLFMQNKANFRKVKLNVTKVITMDYEKKTLGQRGKTKPIKANQSQFKPIKANKMPKQSQSKPIKANLSQLKPIKCQNKANSNPNKPKQTQSPLRQGPANPQKIIPITALSRRALI